MFGKEFNEMGRGNLGREGSQNAVETFSQASHVLHSMLTKRLERTYLKRVHGFRKTLVRQNHLEKRK